MHEEMHIDSHFPQAFKVLERDERLAAEYGRRVFGNQQYPWRLALTNLWHQTDLAQALHNQRACNELASK